MQVLLFVTLFGLIGFSYQAIDTNFCDINTLPVVQPEIPFPLTDIYARYTARVETNDGITGATEETELLYDGKNNIGVSMSTIDLGLISARMYAYADTDELLIETNGNCITKPLRANIIDTPFYINQVGDKEHIASGIIWVANPNIIYKYTGRSTVRNMPAYNWQTCYYDVAKDQTQKITVSFTGDGWFPAYPEPGKDKTWVPVQIFTETKKGADVRNTVSLITEFKYITTIPEEIYIPRPGVYCVGRKSTKPMPNIPTAFSFISQLVTAIPGTFGKAGIVRPIREHYDYRHKLFRIDYVDEYSHKTQLHDFNTGLNYTFDVSQGTCIVDKITHTDMDSILENGLISMKNMSSFFDFDSVAYQYVGQRRIDGVNTDVWIGEKDGQTHEWNFRTDDWFEATGIKNPPVLYTRTDKKSNAQLLQHFFDVRESSMRSWEYDISLCESDQAKGHYSFAILTGGPEHSFFLRHDRISVQNEIVRFIREHAKVTALRINKIELFFERSSVIVSFILYERVKSYGNVVPPTEDVTLKVAVKNLETVFKKSTPPTLTFRSVNGTRILNAQKNSFRAITIPDEGTLYIDKVVNVEENSDGAVAAVTIVATLVGISVGILLMVLHKLNKINLPFLKLFIKD